MDKIKEATNVIIDINKFREGRINDYDLITSVCSFFDRIKNEKITEPDLRFLKYLSSAIGIPHFYDLLEKFNKEINIENYDLNTLSAIIYESTLSISEKNKVHKYQKQILQRFNLDSKNRFFLSASTSFGKTHIVFEIIKKMNYKNVVLIFPTIALLSENMERLTTEENYQFFLENYSIHTLSEVNEISGNNLFIYTPERFLSFLEKKENEIKFDFAFIDEVYKIDNEYIIDEEVRENERDVAYRLAVFHALKHNPDILLAGPYIDFSKPNDIKYNSSFDKFISQNQIIILDYNNYEIVNKSFTDLKSKNHYTIDEELTLTFSSKDKTERFIEIINSIVSIKQNTIVYCYSRNSVESYTKILIKSGILQNHDSSNYKDFINHISNNFNKEWVLIEALKNGIGIHHGLIPKYLQKEIISLFNKKPIESINFNNYNN